MKPAADIIQFASTPQPISSRENARRKGMYVGSGKISGFAFTYSCVIGFSCLISLLIALLNRQLRHPFV